MFFISGFIIFFVIVFSLLICFLNFFKLFFEYRFGVSFRNFLYLLCVRYFFLFWVDFSILYVFFKVVNGGIDGGGG